MPQVVPHGWTQTDGSLTRTIQRADFVEALATVVEIGRLAELADHHPDIDIRYRTLHLSLSTHSADHTVTDKDFALAQKINDLKDESIRLVSDKLRHQFQA
jgi:4a-hydroxytetrahydrobiopterin dehydratase